MGEEKKSRIRRWTDLWHLLRPAEKELGMSALVDVFQYASWRKDVIVNAVARGTSCRPETLNNWPRDRLSTFLLKHAEMGFTAQCWELLFEKFFDECAENLRWEFSALVDPESEETSLPEGAPSIDLETMQRVAKGLCSSFDWRLALLLAGFLRLRHPGWAPLLEQVELLIPVADVNEQAPASPEQESTGRIAGPAPAPEADAPVDAKLAGFTTLDRILIEQVVSNASAAAGGLSAAQVEDLLETVVSLNPRRFRSYFHLGLMDALLPAREFRFDRPEFNDQRRQWYLAGALYGLVRQRKSDALREVLLARSDDFRRAAATGEDGPGPAMAKDLVSELVDAGRVAEAALLVEHQAVRCGIAVAEPAVRKATELFRKGEMSSAEALLDAVRRKFEPGEEDPAEKVEALRFEVMRRTAQCLQARGDFKGSAKLLDELLGQSGSSERARTLSDRGLVAARIRKLADLRIPVAVAEGKLLIEALKRGEKHFKSAIEDEPEAAVGALLALGMMDYLQWRASKSQAPGLLDSSLDRVQQAITGMRLSEASANYEKLGLLGQGLFMQAVLQMHRGTPADANAAFAAWEEITSDAGMLPQDDLQRFLEAAYVADESRAVTIAEAIWRFQKGEAMDIVANELWLSRSSLLRTELLTHARDRNLSRNRRWELWKLLVPAHLRIHETTVAQEGLDAMEELCESTELARRTFEFLENRTNYDPAWGEYDALWAKVQLTRRVNDDTRTSQCLYDLFFLVRDERPEEAEEIVALFRAWRLDAGTLESLQSALPAPAEDPEVHGYEQRLRRGEQVTVLFVGGNEIQAQYDGAIREKLMAEYPRLQVVFRHTGWSSNWGQILDGLIKQANSADAVVLMTMMRTMLGRGLRAGLEPNKPWVSCAARGEQGLRDSIHRAAIRGLRARDRRLGLADARVS